MNTIVPNAPTTEPEGAQVLFQCVAYFIATQMSVRPGGLLKPLTQSAITTTPSGGGGGSDVVVEFGAVGAGDVG